MPAHGRSACWFAVVLVAVFASVAPPASAISVTTGTDEWTPGGSCSIREAVRAMNTAADFQGCTAGFSGYNNISISIGATLTRTGADDTTEFGDLDILRSGTSITSLAGGSVCWDNATANRDRVFDVNPAAAGGFSFSLNRITICNGLTTGDGGGLRMSGSGGTLSIEGVLSANTVLGTIFGNSAARGGGLYAAGNNVTLDNVMVFDNVATGSVDGGGAVAFGAGGGTITDSQFLSNSATGTGGLGGAVFTAGSATIRRTDFAGNHAAVSGGGIAASTATGVANVQYSRLVNNTVGLANSRQEIAGVNSGTFDAEHVWWGSNAGQPASAASPSGVVDSDPLELRVGGPASLNKNQGGTLTADLLGGCCAQTDLDGLPPLPFSDPQPALFHNPVNGSLSNDDDEYVDGKADATFTAGNTCGTASAQATLDSQTLTKSITVPCDHDLSALKSNNVSGQSVVGGSWTWTITIANTGTDPIVFSNGQKILRDELPAAGLSYGTVTVPSNVSCTITSGDLVCSASGTRTIAGNSSIVISVPVTANAAGTFTNPRSPGGACTVDPDNVITTETNAGNNGCGPDQVEVDKAPTTTSITSDAPDPSPPGTDVTVKYTVSGPGTETGSVTVSDGVDSCVASVADGECLITMSTLGPRTLTAHYEGDANHEESTSLGEPHSVAKLGTSTSIDSDTPDPSLVGTAVEVEYSVTGTGTPTGNVTVSDGVDSCTDTVAEGSCSITLTTAGARTLTAEYEGDATHDGSTSLGEPHTVNKIATTTTIDSDAPDPSAVGAAVTVQYTVTGAPAAANVTVSDGVDSCTATVLAGQCSITLTTPGARTLTASYDGDATHEQSSDTEAHTVNSPPTITVLAGGPCNSTTLATVRLSIVDPDGDALTVTAVSSNTAIATGVLGGSGSNRTLAVTGRKAGTATITVQASDGKGGTASLVVTARVGGNGADVFPGAAGTDVLFGINGSDSLAGGGAADYICAGNGTGTLSGGDGNDTIDGQNGDDVLRGEHDNDVLTGGKGNDRFVGGAGLDTFTDVAKGESTDGP